MKSRIFRGLSLIAGVLVACLLVANAPLGVWAQADNVRYFPDTGHNVRGEFLEFFDRQGGLKVFGYPITEEFLLDGHTVQYFQRARFEKHPDNPPPFRVQLGLLSAELGKGMPSNPRSDTTYYQRYFPETGHTVAFAFLSFFDANGGLTNFGYPLTEFVSENGRIVQYFQRAKFEWYPELSPAQRVQLSDLGSIHFDALVRSGRLSSALKQAAPPALPGASQLLSLKVSANPKYTVVPRHGSQTIYVFVTDQKDMPLAGASVALVVRDSSNQVLRDTMPPTDSQGFTTYSFNVSQFSPGQSVIVEVATGFQGLSANTQTSFFTWF